jgi:hypothetical protein
MPTCYENRFSVQLICACAVDPILSQASHDTTLDNHTIGSTLYDVTFLTAILQVSASSRLSVSAPGTANAMSVRHVHGQLPPASSAKVTFTLSAVGSGFRTETVCTAADWALSANMSLGIPSQRFSRNCQYNVSVK